MFIGPGGNMGTELQISDTKTTAAFKGLLKSTIVMNVCRHVRQRLLYYYYTINAPLKFGGRGN